MATAFIIVGWVQLVWCLYNDQWVVGSQYKMGLQNGIRVACRLPLVGAAGAMTVYIRGGVIWWVVKVGGGEKGGYGLRNTSPKGRPQSVSKGGGGSLQRAGVTQAAILIPNAGSPGRRTS